MTFTDNSNLKMDNTMDTDRQPPMRTKPTSFKLTIDTAATPDSNSSCYRPPLPSPMRGGSRGGSRGVDRRSPRKRADYVLPEGGPAFNATKQMAQVFHSRDRADPARLIVHGKIDRGFFEAEDGEWTCYRRNYFQVTGAFGVERLALDDSQYLVRALLNLNGSINGTTRKDDEELWVELADNKRLRLTSYRLGIRARVASSSEEVSLVQNNCRREKDGAERPVTMAVAPGGQLSDIMAHSEMSMASSTMTLNSMTSHSTTSYSMATQSSTQNGLPKVVSFSRLQFKASTGNSNRKSRQFFVMDLALYGFVEGTTTDPVCLAVASSVPVAVRGRSPSYYERPNEASDAANKHFPASPLSPSVYVGFDGINLATSPLLSPSRVPSPLDEANRFADAITQLPAFAAYLQAMSPSPNAVDNVLMTSPQHPAMATFPVSPQHSPLVPLPVSPRVTSQFLAPSPMNVQRRRDSWSTPNVQGLLHPHPHAVALGGPARRNSTGLPQDFLSPMTLSLAMGEQQGIAAAEKPLVQEAKGQAMATPYSPDGITDETLDLYLSSFMVDQ